MSGMVAQQFSGRDLMMSVMSKQLNRNEGDEQMDKNLNAVGGIIVAGMAGDGIKDNVESSVSVLDRLCGGDVPLVPITDPIITSLLDDMAKIRGVMTTIADHVATSLR